MSYPRSGHILSLPYQPPVTASGTNPAPHADATARASIHVMDSSAFLAWTLVQGSAGAAGSGAYRWRMPAGLDVDLAVQPVGSVVGVCDVRGTVGVVKVASEREISVHANGEVADDWQGFNLTGTWSWTARVPIL